jgi:hypothetical protein
MDIEDSDDRIERALISERGWPIIASGDAGAYARHLSKESPTCAK